jgi:hypothetical protein
VSSDTAGSCELKLIIPSCCSCGLSPMRCWQALYWRAGTLPTLSTPMGLPARRFTCWSFLVSALVAQPDAYQAVFVAGMAMFRFICSTLYLIVRLFSG